MPRAVLCLPTYNERENLEPMIEALGEALDTSQDRVLVIDDGSPDGTGEIADRLAAEHLVGLRAPPRRRRRGSARRTSRGSVGRSRKAPSSSSRWTATSPTTPPTSRGSSRLRRTPTSCSDRATRRAVGRRTGVSSAGSSLAAAASTRRSSSGCAFATSRAGSSASGAQTLEAIDLDALVGARLRVPDRDDLPREACRPADPGGPDHVRRAARGASKMTGSIVAEAMWRVPLLRLRALTGKL